MRIERRTIPLFKVWTYNGSGGTYHYIMIESDKEWLSYLDSVEIPYQIIVNDKGEYANIFIQYDE